LNAFDYIISGAGGSGLLLAEQFLEGPLREKQVLLLDPSAQTATRRTWCFWLKDSQNWDHVIKHKWQKLAVHMPDKSIVRDLGEFEYCLVQGEDYHEYVWDKLSRASNVEYAPEAVQSFASKHNHVQVSTADNTYQAEWAFNSSHWGQDVQQMQREYTFLWQHFEGWWIETDNPIFDTNTFTLMDFRTAQHGSIRFFYVLPIAPDKALVELTVFSTDMPSNADYASPIEKYITEQLGIENYDTYKKERGAIPMTNAPFEAQLSPRVFNIGTVGGAVKPSTGYTFMNARVQAEAIVSSLKSGMAPAVPQTSMGRFNFYDTLLLHLLKNYPAAAPTIFFSLFKNNSAQNVLTFLNEDTNLWQEMRLFYGLPKEMFLRALWETHVINSRNKAIKLNPANPIA